MKVCSRTQIDVALRVLSLLLFMSLMHIQQKELSHKKIQSHSPFVPQYFFSSVADSLTTLSYGVASFCFIWHGLSSQLEILFQNFGWHCIRLCLVILHCLSL